MASLLDAAGYRRFSGARLRRGRERIFTDPPVALILMGDWCVPARHDNQVNEDRDAYP